MRKFVISAALGLACLAVPAGAVTVTLDIVDSFARSGPFGLAYDGSNLWWSQNDGSIHEMTTAGVDTGRNITGPNWSALAWSGTQLATAGGGGITLFDKSTTVGTVSYTTLSPHFQSIAGSPQFLTDGLDIQGSTLYWSPDVSPVYASPLDGSGSPTTLLSGPYSGVEYLTAGGSDFLVVVNDGSNPRQLCVHETDATLIGCATLANDRYEDLGYDGTYLYAADYFGNKIDKIRLLANGGVLGGGVPEPATWALMIGGFGLVGLATRRRRAVVAA